MDKPHPINACFRRPSLMLEQRLNMHVLHTLDLSVKNVLWQMMFRSLNMECISICRHVLDGER